MSDNSEMISVSSQADHSDQSSLLYTASIDSSSTTTGVTDETHMLTYDTLGSSTTAASTATLSKQQNSESIGSQSGTDSQDTNALSAPEEDSASEWNKSSRISDDRSLCSANVTSLSSAAEATEEETSSEEETEEGIE